MGLVVDCSVAMAWFFKDEVTPYSEAALDEAVKTGACVPQHWVLEVANAIAMGERRKRVTPEQADVWLEDMRDMSIAVDDHTHSAALYATLKLARACALPSYDAAYLELALRRRLPLATLDKALAKAAKKCGVEMFKP